MINKGHTIQLSKEKRDVTPITNITLWVSRDTHNEVWSLLAKAQRDQPGIFVTGHTHGQPSFAVPTHEYSIPTGVLAAEMTSCFCDTHNRVHTANKEA